MNKDNTSQAFTQLVSIIEKLRTPETGCPWDLEQDHSSLRPYVIEEAYEVIQAIESKDSNRLCDELGDLLLQVVLHAQVAKDNGDFDIGDVIELVSRKMIRRHPHVFGEVKVENSAQVVKNWEQIKLGEKSSHAEDEAQTKKHPIADKLEGIPISIPALLRAQRVGEKAARVHFDWSSLKGVWEKVNEELGELELVMQSTGRSPQANGQTHSYPPGEVEQREELEAELGDLLFSLSQLARWLGLSAEDSLRTATQRFISRFRIMESGLGSDLADFSEEELEKAWQEAKKAEKGA